MVAEWSAVLVVKRDLPAATVAEFVAHAKARPGALNWGTTGFGSFAHLMGEVFMQQTGIAMQHVQYKGGSAATNDLLAGTIDAHMMSSPVAAGQAASPRLLAPEPAGYSDGAGDNACDARHRGHDLRLVRDADRERVEEGHWCGGRRSEPGDRARHGDA